MVHLGQLSDPQYRQSDIFADVTKQHAKLYFLHIPKTSGFSMAREIERIYAQEIVNLGGTFFDIRTTNSWTPLIPKKVISGHYALNPFQFLKFDYSFSIIREPVSRMISLFAYHHRLSPVNLSSKKLFMEFALGMHPKINAVEFAGFDGQPNSQSSYLSTIIYLDDNNFRNLPDSPSIEKVFQSIKKNNIDVFTLDNRDNLIEKLSVMFGSTMTNRHSNVSPRVGFELSKSEISEILKLNSIDHELYETVRERELCSS